MRDQRAKQLDPNDATAAMFQCELAVTRGAWQHLQRCVPRLNKYAPDEPGTAWVAAMSTTT